MIDYSFLLSYLLILIAVFYSYQLRLGIEKSILLNSVRALIQLILLGFILSVVFEIQSFFWLLLIYLLMGGFAAYTGNQRLKLKNGLWIALLSITGGTSLVVFPLLLMDVVPSDVEKFIPLSGMMLGNSMNIYALFAERLRKETGASRPLIEAKLSLGLTPKLALEDSIRDSIRASIIPLLNNLQTVGIVLIPGIMTGMLLSGMPPLVAASYQILIMYMLVGVSLFTAIIGALLLRRKFWQEGI